MDLSPQNLDPSGKDEGNNKAKELRFSVFLHFLQTISLDRTLAIVARAKQSEIVVSRLASLAKGNNVFSTSSNPP
jgi:hypothetical protein